MIERILEALEAQGERECLVGTDTRGERRWQRSAAQVLERTGAWQSELRTRGVQQSDRVGIDLPRGPELLPAHLAVLALGAIVVPLNPALATAERARVLERADLRVLIEPDSTPRGRGAVQLAPLEQDAPALLIFTSGTTGEAKGVPLSLANLEANLAALAHAWGLGAEDRLMHVLPCHHVHGLVLGLYGSARRGISIVIAERFEVETCLDILARERATLLMGVPTMYHRLARVSAVPELPALRLFISGSAPLSPEDFRAIAARFGHEPLERYGLSETLILATNPLVGERRAGSVGRTLPNVELRLAPDAEIEVRGPTVMRSYWRAPDLAAETFRDGFFRTGDLGHFDEAGYLVISGRKKELILVGGSNVLPGEVERGLAGEAGVEELAIVGLPDPDRGEIVAAFVVIRAGEDAEEVEAKLRDRAEHNLAAYKRPQIYRFLSQLPRNATGKLDRRRLSSSGTETR